MAIEFKNMTFLQIIKYQEDYYNPSVHTWCIHSKYKHKHAELYQECKLDNRIIT